MTKIGDLRPLSASPFTATGTHSFTYSAKQRSAEVWKPLSFVTTILKPQIIYRMCLMASRARSKSQFPESLHS